MATKITCILHLFYLLLPLVMSMASFLLQSLLIAFALCAFTYTGAAFTFDDFYVPKWGNVNVDQDRTQVQLTIDPHSGGGFKSKTSYCFGTFEVYIKLTKHKSAGVVTSFYLTSVNQGEGDKGRHNEVDFEFVGTKGILQTNLYANDFGGRGKRIRLWFDPSDGFHKYVIAWYPRHVAFYVDDFPIRMMGRKEGVHFSPKAMHVEASLWNGTWAGNVDWTKGPFSATYTNFTNDPFTTTDYYGLCDYNKTVPDEHWRLSQAQEKQYREIRKKYWIRDWKKSSVEVKE